MIIEKRNTDKIKHYLYKHFDKKKQLELNFHKTEDDRWEELIKDTLAEFEGTEYEELITLTFDKQYRYIKVVRLLNLEKSAYYEKLNNVLIQVALRASERNLIKNRIKVGENK